MTQPKLVVAQASDFARIAAEVIIQEIETAVETRGRCALALAGGSTPRPVYEEMARPAQEERVPWALIDFYFSDERCVPPDSPESNYRMACNALLRGGPVDLPRVHRIEGERPDRDNAAADYAALLPPRLDLLLLGMGADGHTASLFPGSPALDVQAGRVVAVQCPKPPPWRITITPPVIADAVSVIVLAAGKDKAGIVARAIRGPYAPKEIPVQLALRGIWILDRAAASEILDLAQRLSPELGAIRGAGST